MHLALLLHRPQLCLQSAVWTNSKSRWAQSSHGFSDNLSVIYSPSHNFCWTDNLHRGTEHLMSNCWWSLHKETFNRTTKLWSAIQMTAKTNRQNIQTHILLTSHSWKVIQNIIPETNSHFVHRVYGVEALFFLSLQVKQLSYQCVRGTSAQQ